MSEKKEGMEVNFEWKQFRGGEKWESCYEDETLGSVLADALDLNRWILWW